MALGGLVGTMWRLPAALPHPPVAPMLPSVQGWLNQAPQRPFSGLHVLGLAKRLYLRWRGTWKTRALPALPRGGGGVVVGVWKAAA